MKFAEMKSTLWIALAAVAMSGCEYHYDCTCTDASGQTTSSYSLDIIRLLPFAPSPALQDFQEDCAAHDLAAQIDGGTCTYSD